MLRQSKSIRLSALQSLSRLRQVFILENHKLMGDTFLYDEKIGQAQVDAVEELRKLASELGISYLNLPDKEQLSQGRRGNRIANRRTQYQITLALISLLRAVVSKQTQETN